MNENSNNYYNDSKNRANPPQIEQYYVDVYVNLYINADHNDDQIMILQLYTFLTKK